MRTATFYEFDHDPAPDSCWSLSTGPDGKIYAASCCECVAGGTVKLVRYNDETDSLDTLCDMAEIAGIPKDDPLPSQCKIHYSFAPSQSDGILYAATHLSAPAKGKKKYSAWGAWNDPEECFPQSMLMAWNTRKDEALWVKPFIRQEGCRCLAINEELGLLYAISYPRDHFYVYHLKTHELRDLGRIGSVNAQCIFTDRRGRAFFTNCSGQLVRYTPQTDTLEELPVYLPHGPLPNNGWHDVIYDAVASPEGDCIYGVPWNTNPHLFRYFPEDGPNGRMENLGPVHQTGRDYTMPVCYFHDHCGGLVFGADGMLYFVTSRWDQGTETALLEGDNKRAFCQGVLVQMDPVTLEKKDIAIIERPGGDGHYVSRAARDKHGNLFFGQVTRPLPVGISRLTMDAKGTDLHLPLRTWG